MVGSFGSEMQAADRRLQFPVVLERLVNLLYPVILFTICELFNGYFVRTLYSYLCAHLSQKEIKKQYL